MRVYEFAKKHDVSSKEVLDLLKKGGFELASHMTVVPEDGVVYLEKNFSKTKKVSVAKKIEKKITTKKVVKAKVEDAPKATAKTITKPIEKETKAVTSEKKVAVAPVQKKEATKEYVKPLEKTPPKTYTRPGRHAPQVRREITEMTIENNMPLFEVADLMGKSSGDLILALLKKGMVCNINYLLPVDVISSLGEQFGISVIIQEAKESSYEEEFLKKSKKGETRWPIVVVMGHVDHGKTTLLDFIRKMNTVAKEKGGITQHLGAYEVNSSHGKIVFLDTPGHEAFSYIRSRGAKVTDIAVLIVAADDGVKPQTVEAIKHAKDAKVPIIVAINKIDKAGSAAIQTVKRQLAEKDLVPEDWGGDIICVPISAKTGEGVEELLEMIVLQAQMMEIKASPSVSAKAFILESNLEKGHGPVATVICLEGTLKQGDYFICGAGTGKVRLLINSFGQKIAQAGPSIPVKVVGFDKFAEIGGWLKVVSADEYFKAKASKGSVTTDPVQALMSSIKNDSQKRIDLIIKTDTRGSKEAIEGSIKKLSKSLKKGHPPVRIIQCGIGDISEGDVELAETTNSYVIGLHVKIERNAVKVAKEKKVEVQLFQVIYHMVKYLEELLEKEREIKTVLVKKGEAYVKKVFNIKKIGIIAGCYVKEGIFSRNSKVVCLRNGEKVGEGKIKSLQREGKVVKEIHAGYECGFICEGFNDWQVDDIVQSFSEVKEKVD